MKKYAFSISFLLLSFLTVSAQVPVYEREISAYTKNPPRVDFSSGDIAVSSSGDVYVSDYFRGVRIFSTDGAYKSMWGNEGAEDIALDHPSLLRLDANGNVYVLESELIGSYYTIHVKQYDTHGVFVAEYGTAATGRSIQDIQVDANGNVYILDSGEHTVYVYNNAGVLQFQCGSFGSGNGQFQYAISLALDASGNIYVLDANKDNVQKFSSNGTYISKWSISAMHSANRIRINPVSGNIFINNYGEIHEYAVDGTYVGLWQTVPMEVRNFTISDQGNFYVAVFSTPSAIYKYNSTGTLITQWGERFLDGPWEILRPRRLALDANDNLYVTDDYRRIHKYAPDHTFITSWYNQGTQNGEFGFVTGFAVDATGNIYTSETPEDPYLPANLRVQKLSSTMSYLYSWGSNGTGDGEFGSLADLALDQSGNVYVIDQENNRIQKFSNDGTYITQWGTDGTGDGEFDAPNSIAIDADGNVFVSDSGNYRIQKFTSAGVYVTQWGTQGNGDGQFGDKGPAGLITDAQNNVYVVDPSNYRIQKFTNAGAYVLQFGTYGRGAGELLDPMDIAISSDNKIYVSDHTMSRILIYSTSSTTPVFDSFSDAQGIVYPNPSTGRLLVDTKEELQSVTLINVMGQREAYTSAEINTRMKGLLIVEIKTDKGVSYEKVLVE